MSHFGLWDFLLLLIVPIQGTIIAYLYLPRWKAFILTLPFPFTIATLALGRPVGITHVLGLILLLLFTHGVRFLYLRMKFPIIPAIAISALGYCGCGAFLNPLLPKGDWAFWTSVGVVFVLAVVLYIRTPFRDEPGLRSPLPLWVKFPSLLMVVAAMLLMKSLLQGFMTVFPMVGVITAYEARNSLWTICRQIPVLIITLLAMMSTIRLLQNTYSLAGSLAIGWLVFLITLTFMTHNMLLRDHKVSVR